MVKNEVDIVRAWVKYHASLIGLQNLVVVDNESTDGTREALAQLGVATLVRPDYRKKGEYMTELARGAPNELVIPLDMDEFLVLYDTATNTISCNVLSTLVILPQEAVYKMNCIEVKPLAEYATAPAQATRGRHVKGGSLAKSFFHTAKFSGVIDNSNRFPTPHYLLTPLCVVHYHYRNRVQYYQKVKAAVEGLGYPVGDLPAMHALLAQRCAGHHHVAAHIAFAEGTFAPPTAAADAGDVDLSPLVRKILAL